MEDLIKKLEFIAFSKSKPFCYGCYKEAPSGRCEICHSDDLMRLVDGVGVEFGTDWVVKHLIETNLSKAETESAFEESVCESYPETVKVGWMDLDTITVMKTMDRVWWNMAHGEYVDNEVADDRLITFDNGSTYFQTSDVERFVEEQM